jgi:hypothetical protein
MELLGRVDAGGVPEHESARVERAGRLDLGGDVGRRVRAAEREVLEPGDDRRLLAGELRLEVGQRLRAIG